jgi:hypothetical protein
MYDEGKLNSFYKDALKNLLRLDRVSSIPESKIMFVAHDVDRGFIFDGKAYSQLVDSVAEHLNIQNCVTIASPFSSITGDLAYGTVFSVNGMFARGILKRFIMRKLMRRDRQTNCAVSEVWSEILKQVRPKIIIGIQPAKELCVAASEIGIPVFDLQHGVLSDEGYYGAGYRADIQQQGWPDGILCWDQESADWFAKNCARGQAIVVGHPWVSKFLFPKANDVLVKEVSRNFELPTKSPRVLVTLSWGLQAFGVTPAPIGIVQEVVDVILSGKIDCQWLLRLHPIQIRGKRGREVVSRLEQTFGHMDNVEWEKTSAAPLPLVLKQTDLHLTCMSSVILEAARFGIKSGVVFENENLVRQWYGPQFDQGQATHIPLSIEKIATWLSNNLPRKNMEKVCTINKFNPKFIFQILKPNL